MLTHHFVRLHGQLHLVVPILSTLAKQLLDMTHSLRPLLSWHTFHIGYVII